jgi:hypothetical protein
MGEVAERVQLALDDTSKRILKVLDEAEANGWTVGLVTVAVRISPPGQMDNRASEWNLARAFYAIWEMAGRTAQGRPSWKFLGARARNGQPLSESDISIYLKDPSAIWTDEQIGQLTSGKGTRI